MLKIIQELLSVPCVSEERVALDYPEAALSSILEYICMSLIDGERSHQPIMHLVRLKGVIIIII